MIHYHGTPITPEADAAKILAGRHAMVSFAHPAQLGLVMSVCDSFCVDNGAFSNWKRSITLDWNEYYRWVESMAKHPAFDWAIIPDVIDGDEEANDNLLTDWPFPSYGVPVWHMHESLARLHRLVVSYERIAIGSSGQYATVGNDLWWMRMGEAMDTICDEQGRPDVKIHGLRMLNPRVFTALPLASADSTNVAQNIGIDSAWRGTYTPATKAARGVVMAERIEHQQSAATWSGYPDQIALFEPTGTLFST